MKKLFFGYMLLAMGIALLVYGMFSMAVRAYVVTHTIKEDPLMVRYQMKCQELAASTERDDWKAQSCIDAIKSALEGSTTKLL